MLAGNGGPDEVLMAELPELTQAIEAHHPIFDDYPYARYAFFHNNRPGNTVAAPKEFGVQMLMCSNSLF